MTTKHLAAAGAAGLALLSTSTAADTFVYGLTGLTNTLVRYDADSLLPTGPAATNNVFSNHDLAFDETGRLFGLGAVIGQGDYLFEFNPTTGAVVNSRLLTGGLGGLAARGGFLYGLSGLTNTLVRYNANTLLPTGPAATSNVFSNYDLAFDETGRLFGLGSVIGQGDYLFEFNPATSAVLNSRLLVGGLGGLAARGGFLYGLTGLNNTLVRYNATTLLPTGPAAINNVISHYDLAFDQTGRLFGLGTGVDDGKNYLFEFNPTTGAQLDSETITGAIGGLAAQQVPEPSLANLSLLSASLLSLTRRKRPAPRTSAR